MEGNLNRIIMARSSGFKARSFRERCREELALVPHRIACPQHSQADEACGCTGSINLRGWETARTREEENTQDGGVEAEGAWADTVSDERVSEGRALVKKNEPPHEVQYSKVQYRLYSSGHSHAARRF